MSIEPRTKRGLRPWTRLPWSCSIRKEHCTPLVERRRSGPASQRSRRREARFECNFERIGKGTDLHGRVVWCLMWSWAVAGQISRPARSLMLSNFTRSQRERETARKKERKKETVLKEISMHTFVWVDLARIETFFFFFSASDNDRDFIHA